MEFLFGMELNLSYRYGYRLFMMTVASKPIFGLKDTYNIWNMLYKHKHLLTHSC